MLRDLNNTMKFSSENLEPASPEYIEKKHSESDSTCSI